MSQIYNVALTGIPRSGTTLACALLNKAAQAVALAEPLDPATWPIDISAQISLVERQFVELREYCLRTGTAPSRQRSGVIVDNFFYASETGLREYAAELASVAIGKPLRRDFLLAIKQNAAFLALLKTLSMRMHVVVMVRNPLAVLASWSSVDLPVAQGRLPMAERMDARLHTALDGEGDLQRRQLRVLEWCYRQVGCVREQANVLRYERLIASRGRALLLACGLPEDALSGVPDDWLRMPASVPRGKLESCALALEAMPADAAWRMFYSEPDLHQYLDTQRP